MGLPAVPNAMARLHLATTSSVSGPLNRAIAVRYAKPSRRPEIARLLAASIREHLALATRLEATNLVKPREATMLAGYLQAAAPRWAWLRHALGA